MKKENTISNTTEVQNIYDHMVYVRLFEGCNLHCEHCFIPSNPKKINADFYENKNFTNVLNKNVNLKQGDRLYLQWHGGEPTLLGVDYLESAIKNILEEKSYEYINGIQTNLMNFHENTDRWVNLYKKYFDNSLGISWDYKIRHLKIKSISDEENNEKFENVFWKNVSLAKENNLNLYMVITVTKLFFEHFKNPFDFFEFITAKGIDKLNFERITKTGFARETWEKLGLSNKDYSENMSRFYKAYKIYKTNNPEININISPFDGLEISVKNLQEFLIPKNTPEVWDIMSFKNQGYGCWSGECDTKFHTIDSNGYKHGCTALTSEQDNKVTKDIVTKIVWFKKDENQKNTILETRKIRQESCIDCEFIKICSSGCLSVEKFDESNECSGAKTLFKTIKKLI